MSKADLDRYLSALKADLEELQEERMFVLGQTGLHVSAGAVKKYETEMADLEKKIAEVEEAARTRSA